MTYTEISGVINMNIDHMRIVLGLACDGDALGLVPVLIPALPKCLCAVV